MIVYVNQRDVAEYTVTEVDSDEYDYIFVVDNKVQDIVPVEFTNEWRHVGNLDDKAEVSDVVAFWQKTDGTEFIQLMEGSVEIIPIGWEDEVVEIRIIEHLKATLDQEANAAVEFVTDGGAMAIGGTWGIEFPAADEPFRSYSGLGAGKIYSSYTLATELHLTNQDRRHRPGWGVRRLDS